MLPPILPLEIIFYDELHEYFLPSTAIVVGGDFNCYDNPLDKFGNNSFIHKEYDSLRNDFSLVVWRKLHPIKREFTWFNSSLSLASRLDKFLISKGLCRVFSRENIIMLIYFVFLHHVILSLSDCEFTTKF